MTEERTSEMGIRVATLKLKSRNGLWCQTWKICKRYWRDFENIKYQYIFHEIRWCCENKWSILETWRHVTDTATSNKSIITIWMAQPIGTLIGAILVTSALCPVAYDYCHSG